MKLKKEGNNMVYNIYSYSNGESSKNVFDAIAMYLNSTNGELIALDILYKYIIEVLDIAHERVMQMKPIQGDDISIDDYLRSLKMARTRIMARRQSAYQQMESTLSFIQSILLIEKQLQTLVGTVSKTNG